MAKKQRTWPPAEEPLPAPVIDNHCHLPILDSDSRPVLSDDAAVLADHAPLSTADQLSHAEAVGVAAMISVGCDLDALAGTVDLARTHRQIGAAVAIHPNEVPLHAGVREVGPDGLEPRVAKRHDTDLDTAIAAVADHAADDAVVSVGETGLDYFRTGERGKELQREAFRDPIALAKELGKPLQVHDRDAHDDIVDTLLADGAPQTTVIHCFSGDEAMAQACVDNGWYVSVAGPVTFKANDAGRQALRVVPPELLLVETDAPYLTPAPYRGHPNAPYVITRTVRALAKVKEWPVADMAAVLMRTSARVYGEFWTHAVA